MVFLCLLNVGWRYRNEAGAVIVVSRFPNDDDLIGCDVTGLAVIVAKVDHTAFYFHDLAP